ncbi:hypothetical protein BCR34DRAFT_86858 [Clohesyomyces aquaticus]|uniref:Uncharacterized protein n=1 Tax=Clohesyomyces aquaticus TaxID=1231657 RepID=A0A1Y2A2P7_9PLEO|nr:hypothetical protein BCR34DRAFT_86858 [Clohesyomyces aquaticus]
MSSNKGSEIPCASATSRLPSFARATKASASKCSEKRIDHEPVQAPHPKPISSSIAKTFKSQGASTTSSASPKLPGLRHLQHQVPKSFAKPNPPLATKAPEPSISQSSQKWYKHGVLPRRSGEQNIEKAKDTATVNWTSGATAPKASRPLAHGLTSKTLRPKLSISTNLSTETNARQAGDNPSTCNAESALRTITLADDPLVPDPHSLGNHMPLSSLNIPSSSLPPVSRNPPSRHDSPQEVLMQTEERVRETIIEVQELSRKAKNGEKAALTYLCETKEKGGDEEEMSNQVRKALHRLYEALQRAEGVEKAVRNYLCNPRKGEENRKEISNGLRSALQKGDSRVTGPDGRPLNISFSSQDEYRIIPHISDFSSEDGSTDSRDKEEGFRLLEINKSEMELTGPFENEEVSLEGMILASNWLENYLLELIAQEKGIQSSQETKKDSDGDQTRIGSHDSGSSKSASLLATLRAERHGDLIELACFLKTYIRQLQQRLQLHREVSEEEVATANIQGKNQNIKQYLVSTETLFVVKAKARTFKTEVLAAKNTQDAIHGPSSEQNSATRNYGMTPKKEEAINAIMDLLQDIQQDQAFIDEHKSHISLLEAALGSEQADQNPAGQEVHSNLREEMQATEQDGIPMDELEMPLTPSESSSIRKKEGLYSEESNEYDSFLELAPGAKKDEHCLEKEIKEQGTDAIDNPPPGFSRLSRYDRATRYLSKLECPNRIVMRIPAERFGRPKDFRPKSHAEAKEVMREVFRGKEIPKNDQIVYIKYESEG